MWTAKSSCCVPVISTLGWSVSEKDTEWKLASDVTCRGEKLMLRAATVRGWQPHPGALSRACLATLLRVLMTGMLLPVERKKKRVHIFQWYLVCQIPCLPAKSSLSFFPPFKMQKRRKMSFITLDSSKYLTDIWSLFWHIFLAKLWSAVAKKKRFGLLSRPQAPRHTNKLDKTGSEGRRFPIAVSNICVWMANHINKSAEQCIQDGEGTAGTRQSCKSPLFPKSSSRSAGLTTNNHFYTNFTSDIHFNVQKRTQV